MEEQRRRRKLTWEQERLPELRRTREGGMEAEIWGLVRKEQSWYGTGKGHSLRPDYFQQLVRILKLPSNTSHRPRRSAKSGPPLRKESPTPKTPQVPPNLESETVAKLANRREPTGAQRKQFLAYAARISEKYKHIFAPDLPSHCPSPPPRSGHP